MYMYMYIIVNDLLFWFSLASNRRDSISDDPPSCAPRSQKMVPTPSTPGSVKNRLKNPRVKPETALIKVFTYMYSTCVHIVYTYSGTSGDDNIEITYDTIQIPKNVQLLAQRFHCN